jgi:hypothetical protein
MPDRGKVCSETILGMNLTRGVFRLWIIATFAWLAYGGWYFPHCYYVPAARGWPIPCPPANFYDGTVGYMMGLIFTVVIFWIFFPTATCIVIYMILMLSKGLLRIFLWVVHGFRQDQE